MYFKNDGEYTSIVEINGFKFKKIVMKEDSRVTVEVLDMDLNTVSFISVYDSSEIEDAEEVKSVDGFIDVTEVETSPANESESEEDPF
ncbi:DUF1108 family protein [Staphylococcus pseudintermedius]|nr:DUF1108 family protein [Staphylococcus pseudintermedius]